LGFSDRPPSEQRPSDVKNGSAASNPMTIPCARPRSAPTSGDHSDSLWDRGFSLERNVARFIIAS
jgi:hypothetical protein